MSENKEQEFKYTFISPENLFSEEASLEIKEKEAEGILKEERVIEPSTEEIKKEEIKVKEGMMKIKTPEEKFKFLEIKEEKKDIPLESLTLKSQKEPEKEFYLKPQIKIETLETEEKPSSSFNFLPYIKYALIFFISLFLLFSLFYFKPYKLVLKKFSKPKEEVKEIKEEKPLILPEVKKETDKKIEGEKTKGEIEEEKLVVSPTSTSQEPQISLPPSASLLKTFIFPSKEINLTSLSEEELSSKLREEILNKYETPNRFSILEIKINNNYVPLSFVLNYFFKNNLKEKENIFEPNYNILIFYSLSRKNFYILLGAKKPEEVKKLNFVWEKNFNLKNLVNFYPEFTPTKPLSNKFTSKKIGNIEYRELPLENNYSFLWLVYNNYVIYGNSTKGLEKLINFLNLP